MSTWGDISRATMAQKLKEGRASGLSSREILASIDAAYPFGERKYSPYKMWLKVRRDYLGFLGLATPKSTEPDFSGTIFQQETP